MCKPIDICIYFNIYVSMSIDWYFVSTYSLITKHAFINISADLNGNTYGYFYAWIDKYSSISICNTVKKLPNLDTLLSSTQKSNLRRYSGILGIKKFEREVDVMSPD